VYDYLLKAARVRFLLADDAGAGKIIVAGLLIRGLELRGLAERILIVGPALEIFSPYSKVETAEGRELLSKNRRATH
jgi:hypothetical protein